jgi:hypothetical protein
MKSIKLTESQLKEIINEHKDDYESPEELLDTGVYRTWSKEKLISWLSEEIEDWFHDYKDMTNFVSDVIIDGYRGLSDYNEEELIKYMEELLENIVHE